MTTPVQSADMAVTEAQAEHDATRDALVRLRESLRELELDYDRARRGPKPENAQPLAPRVVALRAVIADTERDLETATANLEVARDAANRAHQLDDVRVAEATLAAADTAAEEALEAELGTILAAAGKVRAAYDHRNEAAQALVQAARAAGERRHVPERLPSVDDIADVLDVPRGLRSRADASQALRGLRDTVLRAARLPRGGPPA